MPLAAQILVSLAGLALVGIALREVREAIDDFARTTAERFTGHRSEDTSQPLEAYAYDHFRGRREGAPS